jgi:hypothetical protein
MAGFLAEDIAIDGPGREGDKLDGDTDYSTSQPSVLVTGGILIRAEKQDPPMT